MVRFELEPRRAFHPARAKKKGVRPRSPSASWPSEIGSATSSTEIRPELAARLFSRLNFGAGDAL